MRAVGIYEVSAYKNAWIMSSLDLKVVLHAVWIYLYTFKSYVAA